MPGSINCIDNKTTDSSFFVEDTDNAATTSNLDMRKSRSGGIINSGDTIGNVRFMGFDGATYQVGARIFGITDGTIGLSQMPTDLFFSTAPDSVSSDLLRMTIASTGEVTIAAPDSGTGLTVSGGGEIITAGDLQVQAGNIFLPDSDVGLNVGVYYLNGLTFMANWGVENTYLGEQAGVGSATGTENTGIGTVALAGLSTGSRNTAVGALAGSSFNTPNDCTYIGAEAGTIATSGDNNTSLGSKSLNNLDTGSNNIAIGFQAGTSYTTSESSNILIGNAGTALENNAIWIGTFGTGAGQQNRTNIAGDAIILNGNIELSNYGTTNTFVGQVSGNPSVSTGQANVGLGNTALSAIDTGTGNTALGAGSLALVTSGNNNTGVGRQALLNLVTGASNIGIGLGSGSTYTGAESSNILINNIGVLGESNTIRIGTQGSGLAQQDTCFIAGIAGVSVSNLALVSIDTVTGQLGSTSGGSSFLNALDGDTGTATPSAGVITIAGGNGITTSAAASTVTIDLDAPVSIANGGTNATSFATTDGTVYYDGTRLVTTTTGSAGDVLTSNGIGVAPTYQTPTTGATQFDADSGSATPTAGVINVFGAGTVTTSASGNTITITGSGGSGFTWTVVTGATQAMAVNNGYIANNGGTCVMTLPATAAVGDMIRVTGINNNTGWQIAQNSGQTIYFGDSPTTTGVAGSLASSLIRDSIELVCVVANNDWNVLSAQGNIQVT